MIAANVDLMQRLLAETLDLLIEMPPGDDKTARITTLVETLRNSQDALRSMTTRQLVCAPNDASPSGDVSPSSSVGLPDRDIRIGIILEHKGRLFCVKRQQVWIFPRYWARHNTAITDFVVDFASDALGVTICTSGIIEVVVRPNCRYAIYQVGSWNDGDSSHKSIRPSKDKKYRFNHSKWFPFNYIAESPTSTFGGDVLSVMKKLRLHRGGD